MKLYEFIEYLRRFDMDSEIRPVASTHRDSVHVEFRHGMHAEEDGVKFVDLFFDIDAP